MIAMTCCSSRERVAEEVAGNFLTNYWKADYQAVGQFCTPSMAALVDTAVAGIGALPELVRENMASCAAATGFRITAVYTDSLPDRAIVDYELYAAGVGKPLAKHLVLVRNGRKYLVEDMN